MMKSSRSTPAKLLWDLERGGVSGGSGDNDQDQSRSNAAMQVGSRRRGSVHEEKFISQGWGTASGVMGY